jgi:hypothetical protein
MSTAVRSATGVATEQDAEHLRAVRAGGRRRRLSTTVLVFEHATHDFVLVGLEVDLRRREVGMTEEPLHVDERHLRIGKRCSTRKIGAEEGLSSSLVTQLTDPRPLRLSPSSPFYIPDGFHGLRQFHTGSAPSCPAEAESLYDAADFASCCGPAICSTPLRPRPLEIPEASLPGTLASPRTGLTPAG